MMMTPFKRMRGLLRRAGKGDSETKESAVGGMTAGAEMWLSGPGQPKWTSRRYDRFADEGYVRNVIAFRAVRLIAEGAASVPWRLYDGETEVRRHALLNLLKRPNPLEGGTALLENFYGYLLIAGNAYLEAVQTAKGEPGELYTLRPDRMKVIPGPKGWPRGYRYTVGGQSHTFPYDVERGVTPVLHVKTFHPLDDHYGLSPIEAASYGIDLHNGASAWNKALLDNAARPSGALVYEPGEKGAGLSQAQFDRLKEEMEAQYQGEANAGRPLLLEGGLKWQRIGFSPADMDFINSKHVSAREIALAFGVPPMLLGIPGDNTYSNYQEANRALWRQTLLPLLDKVTAALNGWLVPKFGDGLWLDYDSDAIEALAFDRAQRWQRLSQASFLTVNEKRAALGYGPIEGGDTLQQPAPSLAPFTGLDVKKKDLNQKGVIEDRAARYRELRRAYEQAKEDGKTVKVWRTAGDEKVRDSHAAMEGVAVGIDENFEVDGEALFLPSDPDGSLDETANCRCTVEYEVAQADILAADERQSMIFNELIDAGAGGWTQWYDIQLVDGQFSYKISTSLVSAFQSSFDIEVEFFELSGEQVRRHFAGPVSFEISGGVSGYHIPKIRFRSHSVPVSIHVVVIG